MNPTRRDFLSVGFLGSAVPLFLRTRQPASKNVIVIVLTGGPSQLDTWDLKPAAPSEIRGPFRPIRTNVPGVEIAEIFPLMARHADKYSLIRSVYSDAGHLAHEHGLDAIDAATEGFVTLPGPIGFMGSRPTACASQGTQSFPESCRCARMLIERGTASAIRVNMFETVFRRATWDSHGSQPFSTIQDYRNTVGPAFDLGYSTLIKGLQERGLLESTRVLALGEFGRTPRINPSGGRDHWSRCQTALVAGGGIEGGQVFGSSDATASEPKDDPVSMEQLLASCNRRDRRLT